jgi:hypothetical protein
MQQNATSDPYVTAPPMEWERDALVLLDAELAAVRPDPRIRELALRRAVLAHRAYLAEPSGWASEEAGQAAFALITLDRADAELYADRPIPSSDWYLDPFTYLRREYAAWRAGQDQAAAARKAGGRLRLLPDPPDDAPPSA